MAMCLLSGAGAQVPNRQTEQPLSARERQLLERIDKLEQRLNALEARGVPEPTSPPPPEAASLKKATPVVKDTIPTEDSASLPGFLAGTTLNFNFDGHYGYNTNRPLGRINLLRANDVISNSFTLSQADIVVERAADVSAGRRLGLRLDLMFGQDTETLQGGAQNELRPQVYRNIFQAYGTYIAPVGSGLQLDFGKFASSLGYETNWTKDQINYSRSYYFNFLPFYHVGLRAAYKFNDKFSAQYWLVNGSNQTEDFNGFKSNAFVFAITPNKNIAWTSSYYTGKEGRDLVPAYNPALPELATQPGLSTIPVLPRPNGTEHIFDTYVNWAATSKLTLAAGADYVLHRVFNNSSPERVTGGVGYVKYQVAPTFALGGRFEYLDDRGGFFSGVTQALKESTLTATYQPVSGFQLRGEYRRDFSNRAFFLTSEPGVLKREQDTVTLGLIWWFGGKQGAW